MLNAIRYHIARRAMLRANAALDDYRRNTPPGKWLFSTAYALQIRASRANSRFIQAACGR